MKEGRTETEVFVFNPKFLGTAWCVVGNGIKFTGQCRRCNGLVEREVEISGVTPDLGGFTNLYWVSQDHIRTVEYYWCDE